MSNAWKSSLLRVRKFEIYLGGRWIRLWGRSESYRWLFLWTSFPGIPLKPSCSFHPSSSNNRYLSTNAIVSVGGDKIAAETSLFQIFGTNGARSNLHPREIRVLDAFDDEYGGVIVDPERLPENADAFAYILHSSLSHWEMKVYNILCLCIFLARKHLQTLVTCRTLILWSSF